MQKRPNTRVAFAIGVLMLMIPVLAMLVIGFLSAVHGQVQQTRLVHDQTSALYLAETGLIDAVTQLEIDPDWTAGFNKKRVPGVDGEYSVQFNTGTGSFTADESINNLDGTHNDSYRGSDTVPIGTVSLVSTARVGSHRRQVEALIYLGGGLYPTDFPLLTTGKINLAGNVSVDGVKGQADPTAVNGSVHSNLAETGTALIQWDGTGAANISGKVSVVGGTSGAINIPASAVIAQGRQEGASPKPIPRINVLGKIAAKASAPAPVLLTSGTSTVGSGDFYHSGDVVINGDLMLNGAKLHINGKLTVNGAIRGEGSLYVAGETRFQGDALVSSATPDKVAVYSHGSVVLSGFDGTAYMNEIATRNADFARAWTDMRTALVDLQGQLGNPSPDLGNGNLADQIKAELGGTSPGTPALRPGKRLNNPGILATHLQSEPDSGPKRAMIRKLNEISDVFYALPTGSAEELAASAALRQNRIIKGAFDGMIDTLDLDALPLGSAYANSIDAARLGSASFQGLVYTNGAFVAYNEVSVRGAVVVDNDGSQPDLTVGTETFPAGSLHLKNGTKLTYVEDFFKPNTPGTGGNGRLRVLLWMGR
jgi:hypothetical protein